MASHIELETIGRQLFECLMNRIYNVNDFERVLSPTDRERTAIDAWLDAMASDEEQLTRKNGKG